MRTGSLNAKHQVFVHMAELLLGIDVGTSGAKALVIDVQGNVRASVTTFYELASPKPKWSEQNPHDWWEGTCESVRKVLEVEGICGSDVAAVGVTGQMHGLVLLDESGEVLRPAILWNDQRTDAQCKEIHHRIGRDRMIELTGKPVLTGFTAPKILWVRDHETEVYDGAAKMLLPKDYVRYRLSGEFATDVADASGTSLFDINERRWSDEIFETLELSRTFFPVVYESPEICGNVSVEAAKSTGLTAGTPIVAGAGDQAAEALGCGVVDEGSMAVTIGTSGVVFASTTKPFIDPKGRIHAYCHAMPGMWHVMGVMLSAGGSLQWYRDIFCEEERARAESEGVDVYDLLTREASNVSAGCEGLIFLPYLTGERTPHADPNARGVFFGLTRRHTKAHLTRAVIEGITYGLRDLVELAKELEVPIESVRISGGGARSERWRQMLADVLDCSVATVNEKQGAAFGAAILAGVGIGMFADVPDACRAVVRETSIAEGAGRIGGYERAYELYRSLYPALRRSFEDASRV